MADVIRQDVVQIEFDIEKNPLQALSNELNKIKKVLTGAFGEDVFSDMADDAKGAEKAVKGVTDETKKLGSETKKVGSSGFKKMRDDIQKTVKSLTGGEKCVKGFTNSLKNIAKVSVAKLNSGLKKTKDHLGDISKKAGGAAFNGLKKLAGISFKALAAGLAGAATAIGAVVSKAVQSFGEYEQLKGGMEKIFDQADTSVIMKDARKAYEDLGLSANDYLRIINDTGATFAAVMGDKKGYETARTGLKAISDYASGTGKSVDVLSDKFSMITRSTSSYQSIADQFSGILPATSKDFLKQAQQAGFLSKKYSELTKVPVAEYQEAVSKMLEKGVKDLGLAGNTAAEATGTLTGSLAMTRGAWQNLLTAVGSGEKLDPYIDNLVKSATAFGKQLIPVVKRSLLGIGTVVEQLTPVIAKELPTLAQELIPPLISAAWELTKGLIKALPSIVGTVAKSIVSIFGEQFPVLKKIGDFFTKNAGGIAKSVLGIFVAFKAFKGISFITSLFGKSKGGGGLLGGLTKSIATLGKTKTGIIAKGMANLAIITGGFGVLGLALAGVTKLTSKITDVKSMLKMVGVIGALGLVSGALAKVAGIVGMIPVAIVAKGLAGMAVIIAGMTAVVSAYGALAKIPGFNDFIKFAGNSLSILFNQLGKIAGSVIGGLGEGIANSLPNIGKSLSSFAKSIKPMFATFQGVDGKSVGSFFKSMGSFLLMMAGEKILSIFTGKINFAELGTQLSTFATEAKGFFTTAAALPEKGFPNATSLFKCLAGVKSLPKEGGLAGWFTGSISYESMANGLKQLSSEKVISFFNAVSGLKQAGFDMASRLFDCLAGLKSLPKDGGVVGWFAGEVDYSKIADGLGSLSSEGVKSFFTMVGGLKASAFKNTTELFKSLAGLGDLPKEGGWWDKLTGTETSTIGNIATELSSFADKTKTFFQQIKEVNIGKINSLWESLQNSKKVTASVSKVVDEHISDMVKKISTLPKKMGDALKASGDSLSTAMVSIWKDAVNATTIPVNKLIGGANWVLKQFGSNKNVIPWTPYAKGTNGHRGGNALVNDGRGAELIQMPNGKSFIPQGKNVLIPNAPKGMKVMPAEQTARAMGRTSPTFKYSGGTGVFDIWDYMDNPGGLIRALKGNFVDYRGVTGLAKHIGTGMVDTITGQMENWAKKLYDEFGVGKGWKWPSASRAITSRFGRRRSPGGIGSTNHKGIDIGASAGSPVFASKGGKVTTAGWAGGYGKLVQIDHGQGWSSLYGHNSSLLVSAGKRVKQGQTIALVGSTGNSTGPHIHFSIKRDGGFLDPLPLLGRGFANGGIATRPSIFGEDGAEMAIPLSSDKRDRALNLWRKTGSLLGYTPESGLSGSHSETHSTENNTYAPVFNLTINGSVDDRGTARKVKKLVREAMQEAFESMGRRNPDLQTV